MKKFSTLKQRIRDYFDNQGVDISEIYKNTGISDGTFSNKSGLNEFNILKFFSYYKDIDANWLIKGEQSQNNINDSKYIELLEENRELNKENRELRREIDKLKEELLAKDVKEKGKKS